MNNKTEFKCYGCDMTVFHDGSFPPWWNSIKLSGVIQYFCRNCSCHFSYHPGSDHPQDISPSMRTSLLKRHGVVLGDH